MAQERVPRCANMGANNPRTGTPETTGSGVEGYSDGLGTARARRGYLGERRREFRWIIGGRHAVVKVFQT